MTTNKISLFVCPVCSHASHEFCTIRADVTVAQETCDKFEYNGQAAWIHYADCPNCEGGAWAGIGDRNSTTLEEQKMPNGQIEELEKLLEGYKRLVDSMVDVQEQYKALTDTLLKEVMANRGMWLPRPDEKGGAR